MASDERRSSLRFSRVKIEDSSVSAAGGAAKGSSSLSGSTGNSNSSRSLKDDFDVFLYLNGAEKCTFNNLRDPVLRKMTVSKYEGELDEHGYFHGTGRLVSTLGYTYTGSFSKGLMHGRGKMEWANGLVYDGTWSENVIAGSGRYQWPTGDWYEGQVQQAVRHGKGKFFYSSLNETYAGEWSSGLRDGQGTLEYGGGSVYSGQWKSDKKCGRGTMIYGGRDNYDGDWLDDLRHGSGTMKWYNANNVLVEVYTGQWVSGVQHGQGSVTYIRPPFPHPSAATISSPVGAAPSTPAAANATNNNSNSESLRPKDSAVNTYEGEFFMAKRHGFGTFVYDDGSKYEGLWDSNQKHGQGKYTSATGVVTIGQFDHGTPQTDLGVADPQTGATPPLPLYIRDVLGVQENNVAESVVAVQSVVSRYNGLLKKVFNFYAQLETTIYALPAPPKKERTQGTISVAQFLRLLVDAKLINRDITIAVVDRLLCAFTDRVRGPSSLGLSPQETPGGLPTEQSSAHTSDLSTKRSSSTMVPPKGPIAKTYARPWDQYRASLHMYVGELSFREFVEAIVRVANAYYAEDVWGPLATKVLVAIEDHLDALPCSSATPVLFPRTRDNLAALQPCLSQLSQVFLYYSDNTSLGFNNVAAPQGLLPASAFQTSKSTMPGATIKFRQVALMLKDGGYFDAEKCPTTVLPKMLRWDKFPATSTAIYQKRIILPSTLQQSRPASERCTSAAGDGSHSERGSTAASEGMRSTQTASQATTTMFSNDKYERPILSEAALRSRWAMKQRSKGLTNRNAHATLNMELELTFPEFVEVLCEAAAIKHGAIPWEQRVPTLVKENIAPHFKRLC